MSLTFMYLIYHPRILSGFSGVTGQGCPKVYIFKLFPQNRVYRVNVADRVPKHVGNHETMGLLRFFAVFMEKPVMNYWTLGITFFQKSSAVSKWQIPELQWPGPTACANETPRLNASSSLGQWNSVGQGIWRIWTEKVSEI